MYLAALGQKINEGKSFFYFFNTPGSIQLRIAHILRFQIGNLPLKYLGISISMSRLPKESWQVILDKFWVKVNHWNHRWLSFPSRVQLIKSIVQALPINRCMLQVTPLGFLKDLDSMIHQFLWVGCLETSKWSLVRWEVVCSLKHYEGISLRWSALISEALAVKLYWRWCNE